MIKLDRFRVDKPPVLGSKRYDRIRDKISKRFSQSSRERRQEKVFPGINEMAVKTALLNLSNYRCAYCEQEIHEKSVHIDRYRPEYTIDDESTTDSYWWLAYEWENLLPSCQECHTAKSKFFPVQGERIEQPGTSIPLMDELEIPQILNPTVDDPSDFLFYELNGKVQAKNGLNQQDLERATGTILALNLNRPNLIKSRKVLSNVMKDLSSALLSIKVDKSDGSNTSIERLDLQKKFSKRLSNNRFQPGQIKQFWNRLADADLIDKKEINEVTFLNNPSMVFSHISLLQTDNLSELKGKGKEIIQKIGFQIPESKTQSTKKVRKKEKSVKIGVSWTIKSIHIRNFRAFEKADIEIMPTPPNDLTENHNYLTNIRSVLKDLSADEGDFKQLTIREKGWKVFLGENGSGKSSILHAVAIALGGPGLYKNHMEEFQKSLRFGSRSGYIKLKFHETAEVVEVTINKTKLSWKNYPADLSATLLGFGAIRLMDKRESFHVTERKALFISTDNLFSPENRLINITGWMRELYKKPDSYNAVCAALLELLDLDSNKYQFRFQHPPKDGAIPDNLAELGKFGLNENEFTPLEYFSSGFKTVVIVACQIMSAFPNLNPSDAQGIVLIDEIGAHLHPSWRRRILTKLAEVFPSIQLIASTHEPLCLHGLGEDEVILVEKKFDSPLSNKSKGTVALSSNEHQENRSAINWRAELKAIPESPAGKRSDQLLTSSFFGLNSTNDPRTAELFRTYYEIRAKGPEINELLEEEVNDESNIDPNTRLLENKEEWLEQMKDLFNKIDGNSIIGQNPRDRIFAELIDEFLIRKTREGERSDFIKADEALKRTAKEIMWRI